MLRFDFWVLFLCFVPWCTYARGDFGGMGPFVDLCSANFDTISTKLERSVAFVVAVIVAELAAAGTPFWRSIVPFCG